MSQMHERFALLSDGELLELWQENDRSRWTAEAFDAIQNLLTSRNVTLPSQRQDKLAVNADIVMPAHLKFSAAFKGESTLQNTFLKVCVLPWILFAVLANWLSSSFGLVSIPTAFFYLIFSVYFFFAAKAVWKSSRNYRIFWRILARTLAVLFFAAPAAGSLVNLKLIARRIH